MAVKETQLNLRLAVHLNHWIERQAGGPEKRAEYVRGLIESDMQQALEQAELEMFNQAAADLTDEDRAERELLISAFSNADRDTD